VGAEGSSPPRWPIISDPRKETAPTLTIAGDGTVAGAGIRPFESILPTVSFPPVTLFTCQVTMEFVPPDTWQRIVWSFPTFRENGAGSSGDSGSRGGSVHEFVEVVVDVVAVVVQVMAVWELRICGTKPG